MKLSFPTRYDVPYPKINKQYYSGNKKELKNIFTNVTKYCMYCGKAVMLDNEFMFQLEHSVDKEGNYNQTERKSMLLHCKYNFSIACMNCNMVYKKRVDKLDFSKYSLVKKCPTMCTEMCATYRRMRKDYCEKNAIILQPLGYSKNNVEYKIRYNLLRHVYEADMDEADEDDVFFVEHHIMRFDLNADRFTYNIIDLCVKIVGLHEIGAHNACDILNLLSEEAQPNILGNIFIDFLKEYFYKRNMEELLEFCKLLVVLNAVN